jgi:hypothetical protein
MTMTSAETRPPSVGMRLLYGIPLIGRIARDIARDVNNVFYLMVVIVTLEILAFRLWGPVVFTLTALALVPLMFLFFVFISWPGRARRNN